MSEMLALITVGLLLFLMLVLLVWGWRQ